MLKNKRILITGACGTVGSELVRQLLQDRELSVEVLCIDNNESELFFLEQKFLADVRASFFLADVRDEEKLKRKMSGIDIVFHAAAFKHVVLCERSPYEAVQTNISGVQNVIQAAIDASVKQVIFTSSDKAVNPTSVMGTSKLMGEKLITAANSNSRENGPRFTSTRFGNVLGSRGSVIPIFIKQIRGGGPVTLTDSEMTRFIMSIEEAVRLVIDSASMSRGGEVFITKMPVIRIQDLAEVMIEKLAPKYGFDPKDIGITIIGSKPGEKTYEELMSREETRRALELSRYFAVLPAFRGVYRQINYDYPNIVSHEVKNPYISANEKHLEKNVLGSFLDKNKLLDDELAGPEHPANRYWPGEKK